MLEEGKIFVIDEWRSGIVGLIVSIIFGVLWRLISSVHKRAKLMLTRSIWKPLLGCRRPITIVLTTKKSETPGGTFKASLSEVEAFSALMGTLQPLGLRPELCHRPDRQLRDMHGHVISIGGPKANIVTQQMLAAIAQKYPTMPTYDAQGECIVAGPQRYETQYAPDKTLIKDYGLVIRVTGLHSDPGVCYFVAFALRGRSTWGAVKTITVDEEQKNAINRKAGAEDFVLVLEFSFANNEIIGTKIECLQTFKKI